MLIHVALIWIAENAEISTDYENESSPAYCIKISLQNGSCESASTIQDMLPNTNSYFLNKWTGYEG
ncbi:MAG: hypothetical protein E4G94_03445 [ANME-2 cluster archaeon]|nr:MAG: hypothetical protein E4G94_03445 [ANME-2 cluster archaeon]